MTQKKTPFGKVLSRREYTRHMARLLASAPLLGACGTSNDQVIDTVIAYGAFSPSAANSKPWGIRRSGERIIELSIDRSRVVPNDVFLRKSYVSVGCALETMVAASRVLGLVPSTQIVDADGGDLCAIITLRDAETSSGLAAIPSLQDIEQRKVNRGPYEEGVLDAEQEQELLARLGDFQGLEVDFIKDDHERQEVSLLIKERAQPTNYFEHFDSGGSVAFIHSADPWGKEALIDCGRVLQTMQLFAQSRGLLSQPVGCAMITPADRHFRQSEESSFILQMRGSLSNYSEAVVLGFRIGMSVRPG